MTEVFLENQRLDISEGLSSLISYAIDDIKDFAARNTSVSKTIILPGTRNNNIKFGHIFDVSISNAYDATQDNVGYNFNASKSADVIIFQGNIQVFKGILRLLKIIVTDGVPEYECAVFGELAGLISSIGNKKLENLDLSEHDHVFTLANVTGSWDSFNGSGVVYPLIDYGLVSTNKVDYDISAFRPAISVREYLDKIIKQAGYKYLFDLGETARFKKIIVPNNQKEFQKLSSILLHVHAPSPYLAIHSTLGPFSPQNIKFNTLSVLGSFSTNADRNIFTYGGTDTYQTFFNIELNLTVSGQFFTFGCKLLKNGSPIYDFGDVYRPSEGALTFTVQVSDLPVQVAPGDVFKVELTVTNSGGGLGTYYTNVNEAIWSIVTTNAVYVDINIGDSFSMNDTIPRNISQREFLSSILKLFNLYVYEDKLKNKFLNIKPFVDFYDFNASGIIDWTYKMDRSKPIEIIPMSELNARFYEFVFKTDADYYNDLYKRRYNEGYGDYLFDSDFFFSPDKSTIPLIFSGTPLVGYSGVDKIVSTLYKLSNATEEKMSTIIRILQFKKIIDVTSWAIKDGVSTLLSGLTTYGYAGHYDDPDAPANDIHFGVPKELFFTLLTGAINVHQFNVYWSSYMAEITDKDSKLLTAWFKLSNRDIYDLDFSKPIYLDGSYFRLNKIIDWNANEPDLCKVELLKVLNTVY